MVPKGARHCQKSGEGKKKKNWGFFWPGLLTLCSRDAEQTPISQSGKSGLKHLECAFVARLRTTETPVTIGFIKFLPASIISEARVFSTPDFQSISLDRSWSVLYKLWG
jgi:hypothetical protein